MTKILLVEDNEMNRDMLSRRLVRQGYEVLIALDGERGLAMAVEERPDLVLMDMSLPVIDGWEATRRLKADPSTKVIPIIALTAHALTEDREKAWRRAATTTTPSRSSLPRLLEKIDAASPERRRLARQRQERRADAAATPIASSEGVPGSRSSGRISSRRCAQLSATRRSWSRRPTAWSSRALLPDLEKVLLASGSLSGLVDRLLDPQSAYRRRHAGRAGELRGEAPSRSPHPAQRHHRLQRDGAARISPASSGASCSAPISRRC